MTRKAQTAPACTCGHPEASHDRRWVDGLLGACHEARCPCCLFEGAPKGSKRAATAQEAMWAAQSEAQWQSTVTGLLRAKGFKVFTVRQSAKMGDQGRMVSIVTSDGWPDVLGVETVPPFRIAAWECKRMKDRTDPVRLAQQHEWLEAWRAAGADARFVRPCDWDAIEAWTEGKA